jgi:hypothetical protein
MLSSRHPGDPFDTGRCCLYVAVGELVATSVRRLWGLPRLQRSDGLSAPSAGRLQLGSTPSQTFSGEAGLPLRSIRNARMRLRS